MSQRPQYRPGPGAECSVVGLHDVVVLQESREKTLGECLNLLVEQADGEYGTKWDDDDFYGPLYLSDQVNAVMYSGAEVVGKRAHYMHLTRSKATILRNPQRHEDQQPSIPRETQPHQW